MRQSLKALAVCAGLLSAVATPAHASNVPLPDDLQVVAPRPDVPEALKRFHGKWTGKWCGKLDQILVVEEVYRGGHALVIYAWGDYVGFSISKGWSRVSGKIIGDKMKLDRFRNGAQVTFEYQADGTLKGEYLHNHEITPGLFKRQ